MFDDQIGNRTFEEWMNAFCDRKYNSDFSKELNRSVNQYLDEFKGE
jgi:nitroreductase/FMN reductase (NADPH)/FMN reductase [NAD(P)H]